MRFLLDTHVLLWWISESKNLSKGVIDLVKQGQNTLFWSAASSWEVAIKYKLGRLSLPENPSSFLPKQLSQNNISPLPIQDSHAYEAGRLPLHHQDPFDRMLVAQARIEKLVFVTDDAKIRRYNVDLFQ